MDISEAEETRGLVEATRAEWLEVVDDVLSPTDVARLAEATLWRFGKCDIVINNAGIFPAYVFDDLSFDVMA
ncbi:SDR family oxidoreductase [Polaromonas glacialis]|uniref:SDR family oxidoreductase n=1 Tax=Polaromonas glacialis TaxID=866564 RepID=UPI00068DFC62